MMIHNTFPYTTQTQTATATAHTSPNHKTILNPKSFVKSATIQPQLRQFTDHCLPPSSTSSFSSALRDCQNRKLLRAVDIDIDSHSSNVTFPHYKDLVTHISTPHRFKERKQRTASMDFIANADHIIRRDGYINYSEKTASNAMRESPGDTITVELDDQPPQALNWPSCRSTSSKVRSFPSPASPWREGLSTANSWSYERVSMAATAYRNRPLAARQNMSVKNLPSKWDDAEKWLCSPASSDSPTASSAVYHYRRKPKSKSGPLVVMGLGTASPVRPLYYSSTKTSTAQGFHHSTPHNHIANVEKDNGVIKRSKPAVLGLDNLQSQNSSETNKGTKLAKAEIGGMPSITRCASVDGWSFQIAAVREPARHESYIPELCENNADIQTSPSTRQVLSVPIFSDMLTQDKYADTVLEPLKLNRSNSSFKEEIVTVQTTMHGNCESSMKDAATEISPTVSRRDMATQITPIGSPRTSRCKTPIKSNSPARHNTPARRSDSECNSTLDVLEWPTIAKLDIRDSFNEPSVFDPSKSALSSWSNREKEKEESSKCLKYFDVVGDWKKNITEARTATWEEADRSKCLARFTREAAKITAWENHQKAKGEAKLKKLEMKLEKIRSHSTERIMTKLATCHKKAEDMRVNLAAQQAQHLEKTMERAASLLNKSDHVATLGACFFMKPTT